MRIGLILIDAILLAAVPLAAQTRPHVRGGFTAAYGAAYANARVSCTGCARAGRRGGSSGRLTLGGTLRPDLLLVAELEDWSGTTDRGEETLLWVSLVGQWYPRKDKGWFVRGGFGVANYLLKETAVRDSELTTQTSGLGMVLGAGYDWRFARMLSLTPYLSALWAAPAANRYGTVPSSTRYSGHSLNVGVAMTLH